MSFLNAPSGRILLVSRHPGTVSWLQDYLSTHDRKPVCFRHIEISEIRTGDIVVGTLPIHLVWQLNCRAVRYFHICLDLPETHRGLELDRCQVDQFNPRIIEFSVTADTHKPPHQAHTEIH